MDIFHRHLPIQCAPNPTPHPSWHAWCQLGCDRIITDGPTAQDAVQALLAALPAAQAARALFMMVEGHARPQE